MTIGELLNSIKALSESKKQQNVHPHFVTLKEISTIHDIGIVKPLLEEMVDNGTLIVGDTINDKYFLIPEE